MPRIDFKTATLQTAEHKYRILTESMPIVRYRELHQRAPLMALGALPGDMFAALKGIYTALTSGESPMKCVHEAAVIAMNSMKAIEQANKRELPILELCAVFLVREDEDINTFNADLMKEKIADWERAGVPMEDFMMLGKSVVTGWLDMINFAELLPEVSEQKPTRSKAVASR